MNTPLLLLATIASLPAVADGDLPAPTKFTLHDESPAVYETKAQAEDSVVKSLWRLARSVCAQPISVAERDTSRTAYAAGLEIDFACGALDPGFARAVKTADAIVIGRFVDGRDVDVNDGPRRFSRRALAVADVIRGVPGARELPVFVLRDDAGWRAHPLLMHDWGDKDRIFLVRRDTRVGGWTITPGDQLPLDVLPLVRAALARR